MIQVNEYFDGNVKSLGGFKAQGMNATAGVMAAGQYEFSTSAKEYMTVIAGSLTVKLDGEDNWVTYTDGQTFEVVAGSKFDVKADVNTHYLCRYE